MPFGAATLSAICPCLRELSRPDTRTATDTVRRNILTCANMQERLHYDKYSAGSSKRALPCRGRSESTAASLQAPQHAGTYDLPGPSQNAWPNSFQTSYGNTVSSPVIVRLLAPHATLTGQAGAVLVIFAVAALQAHVLAATIERIARKLLQAGGFVALAAAFASLWLGPGVTPPIGDDPAECAAQSAAAAAGPGDRPVVIGPGRAFADRGEPPLAFPCQLLERRAWSWPGRPQHRQQAGEHVVAVLPHGRHDLAGQRCPAGGCQQPGERLAQLRELLAPSGR